MHLVVGSTGSIGSAIVDELVGRGQRVWALVRDPGKAQRVFTHSGNVEFVVGSVEEPCTILSRAEICIVLSAFKS